MKRATKTLRSRLARKYTLNSKVLKNSICEGNTIATPKVLFSEFPKTIKINDSEIEKRGLEVRKSVDRLQNVLGKM